MSGRIKHRAIDICDRRTSLRLEPQFWFWLRQIAVEQGSTAKALIEAVEKARTSRPVAQLGASRVCHALPARPPIGKSSVLKPRRININGHPTSFKLEPEYWQWLKEIAAEFGTTLKALIEAISATATSDRFLRRSVSLSPPTSTVILTRSTDAQAVWSRCAMVTELWDGREEDAAHKMVRAPPWLIGSSEPVSRARPAAPLHAFAGPTSLAESAMMKPSQDPDILRLRRNGRFWQTARITNVTNRRQAPQRDPEIEKLWPGHIIPSSMQMLEELLPRSLKLRHRRVLTPPAKRHQREPVGPNARWENCDLRWSDFNERPGEWHFVSLPVNQNVGDYLTSESRLTTLIPPASIAHESSYKS